MCIRDRDRVMSDTVMTLEEENAYLRELANQYGRMIDTRNKEIGELIELNAILRRTLDLFMTENPRDSILKSYPFLVESIPAMLRFMEGSLLENDEIEEIRLSVEYQKAGLPGGEGRKVFAQRVGIPDRTLRGYVTKWLKSASENE